MNIGFIGLGKLGLPCAEEIVRKGHFVYGYDIFPVESSLVKIVGSIEKVISESEIIFIAVPTPHETEYDGSVPCSELEPKDFNYDIVRNVLTEASKYLDKSKLLVLISTVLPGTIANSLKHLVINTNFVYNPYLIAMGTVAWDMVNPEMVMIGTEDGEKTNGANTLIDFYKTIMDNDPPYVVGTWNEVECIKVFYNTYISNKISFVNMIQDVSQRLGDINVDVVTDALCLGETRILSKHYMKAGMGDGGACHPRDNIALRYLSKELDLGYDLFQSIIISREVQAKNLAHFLYQMSISGMLNMPIVIHGKSYKPNVPYTQGSYSLLVGHYCSEFGKEPLYVDKMTGDVYNSNSPTVFLLAHSASTTYGKSDELYCNIPSGSIVVDPWRKFKTEDKSVTVIHYGNTRINS